MAAAKRVAWFLGVSLATPALVLVTVTGLGELQQIPGWDWAGNAAVPALAVLAALSVVVALRLGSPRGIAHAVLLGYIPVEVVLLQIAFPAVPKAGTVAQVTLGVLVPVAAAYLVAWVVKRRESLTPRDGELPDSLQATA